MTDKKEINRQQIQLPDGMMADLVTYDIKGYGKAEYIENMEQESGDFRRRHSLLPKNYINVRGSDFKWNIYGDEELKEQKQAVNAFTLNFNGFQKEGKGLYIYSKTKGSGKTMLACCLANEIMERHDITVKFISTVDFIERTKDSFNNYEAKKELEQLTGAKLLIIDDIGAEIKKDWIDMVLFRIIDSRYTNNRVTIFTSNVDRESLKLGDRIKDRIHDMTVMVRLPEVPVRHQLAEIRNREFIERMTTEAAGNKTAPKAISTAKGAENNHLQYNA